MEHAQPVHRPFSWRGVALAVTLLGVIGLAALGGTALLHRLGPTRPAAATGPAPARHVSPAPARPRADVSVLVLNGNGINGAAGAETTRLLARGYRSALAADAPNHAYATSLVLFRPGWESEAQRLARDTGIRTVAPLDGRLPASEAGFRVVVLLGR